MTGHPVELTDEDVETLRLLVRYHGSAEYLLTDEELAESLSLTARASALLVRLTLERGDRC